MEEGKKKNRQSGFVFVVYVVWLNHVTSFLHNNNFVYSKKVKNLIVDIYDNTQKEFTTNYYL